MSQVLKVDEEEQCVPTVIGALSSQKIIRVDGHSGVGKSRIAKALSRELGWRRVAIDDYLDKADYKPRYEKRVMIDKVLDQISSAPSGVILDGLWLDHLVQRDVYGPEYRIYMRACFAPEFDRDEERRRKKLGTDVYHRAYDPARWADLIVMKVAIF